MICFREYPEEPKKTVTGTPECSLESNIEDGSQEDHDDGDGGGDDDDDDDDKEGDEDGDVGDDDDDDNKDGDEDGDDENGDDEDADDEDDDDDHGGDDGGSEDGQGLIDLSDMLDMLDSGEDGGEIGGGFWHPVSDYGGEDDELSDWFQGGEPESGGAGGEDNGGGVDAGGGGIAGEVGSNTTRSKLLAFLDLRTQLLTLLDPRAQHWDQIHNDWLLQCYSLTVPNDARPLNLPDDAEFAWVTAEDYILARFNTFRDQFTSSLEHHHGVGLRSTSQMRFTLGRIDRFFDQLERAADAALGLGQPE